MSSTSNLSENEVNSTSTTAKISSELSQEGSDITRDIYVALFKDRTRRSSKSMPDVGLLMYEDIGRASDIAQPGGFRRNHILANKLSDENVNPPKHVKQTLLQSLSSTYDDFIFANFEVGMSSKDFEIDEVETPLIRRPSRRFRLDSLRQTSIEDGEISMKGSSIKKTVFTILKSFVGSGILFLPKAFQNGGLVFSSVVLSLSAFLSTFCMLRLTECSNVLPHSYGISYGLLGEKSFGNAGRRAVNMSLVLSQLGFCCTYLIFVEKNLSDIINHLTNCSYKTSPWILILLQIPLYTPLTWVRHIEYFAMTNLIADVLILFGLFYIIYFSVETIETSSAPSSWESFNSKTWALFLGTAVYCFEGIGLILPIYDSMDLSVRHRFPQILSSSISFLLVFYCFFAGVVYVAFGENTQSVVTLNLPNDNINFGTISVQITYSIALIFTYPLMLYPVLMILEGILFPPLPSVTKGARRWKKNFFRFILVLLTAGISYFGMEELDNFVALIGGFCSVPLAFIYPCLFHSRLVNDGHVLNGIVVAIGLFTMAFATYQAVSTWAPAKSISYCDTDRT